MAVSPRSFRTPTPNRRAEFALLRQSNGPGAPPRGRPDLVLPDKPTRPGASERRWPREGCTVGAPGCTVSAPAAEQGEPPQSEAASTTLLQAVVRPLSADGHRGRLHRAS